MSEHVAFEHNSLPCCLELALLVCSNTFELSEVVEAPKVRLEVSLGDAPCEAPSWNLAFAFGEEVPHVRQSWLSAAASTSRGP